MAASSSIWETIGQALLGGNEEASRQLDIKRQLALQAQARQDKLNQQTTENAFRQHAQDSEDENRKLNIIKNAIEFSDPHQPIDPATYALAQHFHMEGAFQPKAVTGPSTSVALPDQSPDASQLGQGISGITIPKAPPALPKATLGDASPTAALAGAPNLVNDNPGNFSFHPQDANGGVGGPQVDDAAGKDAADAQAVKQLQPPSGPVGQAVGGVSVPQNSTGFFKRESPQEQILDAKAKLLTGIDSMTGPDGKPLTPEQKQRMQFEAAGINPSSVFGTPPPNINTYDFKPGSNEYKVAQDIAYGKLPFNNLRALIAYSRDPGYKMALYGKASELNPNFNVAAYEMGFKLATDPQTQRQLAAQDNVLNGVQSLMDASNEAARTKMPLANWFVTNGGVQLGDKRYSNFKVAQKAFADELSGALGFGTASDMKLALGLDLADPSLGPEAFMDAVQNIVVPFVQRKRDSLLTQMGRYGQPDMNPAAANAAGGPVPGVSPEQQPNRGANNPAPPQQPNTNGRGGGPGPGGPAPAHIITQQAAYNDLKANLGRVPKKAELDAYVAALGRQGVQVQ